MNIVDFLGTLVDFVRSRPEPDEIYLSGALDLADLERRIRQI